MLAVFLFAFGVSSYNLIYGVQKFSWHLPRRVFNLAYWPMFGELKVLETFERKSNLHPRSKILDDCCTENFGALGYTAYILLVVYMAIVSILLINLLIAMFRYKEYATCAWTETHALSLVTFSTVCKATLIVFGSFNDTHWYMNIYLDQLCLHRSLFLHTCGEQRSISSQNVASQSGYRQSTASISCAWNTVTICTDQYEFPPHQHHVVCFLGKIVEKEMAISIQNWEDASADETYYNYLKEGKTSTVEVDLEDKRTWASNTWKKRVSSPFLFFSC